MSWISLVCRTSFLWSVSNLQYFLSTVPLFYNFPSLELWKEEAHVHIWCNITSPLQVSASSRKRIRWQPFQCWFVLNPLMAWRTGTVTMMYSERLVLIIIVILNLIPRMRGEGHQSLIIIITTYLNCRNKAQLEHLPTAA